MAETVAKTRQSAQCAPRAGDDDAPEPTASLVCLDPTVLPEGATTTIDLYDGMITLGRAVSNTVALKATGVSRRHARLVWENGQWAIWDLESTNGVRVNRKKILHQRLEPGDIVQLGRVRFEYRPARDREDANPSTLVDGVGSTVVISPGVKLLEDDPTEVDDELPVSAPSGRVPGREPHPRTTANMQVAQDKASKARRRESDSWLWWVAAGVIIILAVGFGAL